MKPFGVKVLIVEPSVFRTELAGPAMKHMPEIDAYSETVGSTRQFARALDATQQRVPRKAATAIEQALEAEETPLQFLLGEDAVK